MIFLISIFVVNFRHFAKNILALEFSVCEFLVFFQKNKRNFTQKKKNKTKNPILEKRNIAPLFPQLLTINMKGCLRFFYFHIWNIAKFG
jgi:hypothetical protein